MSKRNETSGVKQLKISGFLTKVTQPDKKTFVSNTHSPTVENCLQFKYKIDQKSVRDLHESLPNCRSVDTVCTSPDSSISKRCKLRDASKSSEKCGFLVSEKFKIPTNNSVVGPNLKKLKLSLRHKRDATGKSPTADIFTHSGKKIDSLFNVSTKTDAPSHEKCSDVGSAVKNADYENSSSPNYSVKKSADENNSANNRSQSLNESVASIDVMLGLMMEEQKLTPSGCPRIKAVNKTGVLGSVRENSSTSVGGSGINRQVKLHSAHPDALPVRMLSSKICKAAGKKSRLGSQNCLTEVSSGDHLRSVFQEAENKCLRSSSLSAFGLRKQEVPHRQRNSIKESNADELLEDILDELRGNTNTGCKILDKTLSKSRHSLGQSVMSQRESHKHLLLRNNSVVPVDKNVKVSLVDDAHGCMRDESDKTFMSVYGKVKNQALSEHITDTCNNVYSMKGPEIFGENEHVDSVAHSQKDEIMASKSTDAMGIPIIEVEELLNRSLTMSEDEGAPKQAAAAGALDDSFNLPDDFNLSQLVQDAGAAASNLCLKLNTLQRCSVVHVEHSTSWWEKEVTLKSTSGEDSTVCLLKGPWGRLDLHPGDTVNVLAVPHPDPRIPWQVDTGGGMVVFQPDYLVSGTAVVGSLFCRRRGVLGERFRGIGGDSHIMVVGSLVHELLQAVLTRQLRTAEAVTRAVDRLLDTESVARTLFACEMKLQEARRQLMAYVPRIVDFMASYVSLNKESLCTKSKVFPKEDWDGQICGIQDIEENVWVPQLGMKGKVDVTVEVKIHNRRKVLPLELKTGRASHSAEHRGQLILYVMMMAHQGREVDSGLLLYLKEGTVREVTPSWHEQRDLVLLRNEMVSYLSRCAIRTGDSFKPLPLPEPINHPRACSTCPYLTLCSTFLRADGMEALPTGHSLLSLVPDAVAHLSPCHREYLLHWNGLLLLEEQERVKSSVLRELWDKPAATREQRGKSLSSLLLAAVNEDTQSLFLHSFCRSEGPDLQHSGLVPGEMVVISTAQRVALATGSLVDISERVVVVAIERSLSKGHLSQEQFHIDLYESQNMLSFNLSNLGALMENTEPSARLRAAVIDRELPKFADNLPPTVLTKGHSILDRLNAGQQSAVLKAISAHDYLLIRGMPGTGKTATIVALVELMVQTGRSVLLTSHTHSAVDNMLGRLAERGVSFLRLGPKGRVRPDLQAHCEASVLAGCRTPADVVQAYAQYSVVATTVAGAHHPATTQRTFDMCIVDESTQVLQPAILRPLFAAQTFVLVGDSQQLRPVVRSVTARDLGLAESLFLRLDCAAATVNLDMQYRMNLRITQLANKLTYGGQLQCGNTCVAEAVLELPAAGAISQALRLQPWMARVFSPLLKDSVIFLDTGSLSTQLDNIELKQSKAGAAAPENRACRNPYEAAVVLSLVHTFRQAGISGESIGVMAPYRAQVALLTKLAQPTGVEVNTVDQFQGRDKPVVLYSCTRSLDVAYRASAKDSELLADKRRLTVAVTRAKVKLVLVGDAQTLYMYESFRELFAWLGASGVVPLEGVDWEALLEETRRTESVESM